MKQIKLKGKAYATDPFTVDVEFGRFQADMLLSRRGKIARQLGLSRLKPGEEVKIEVILRKK